MVDVKVKDYQSIKDVTLRIEGLTILKGESNAGKSSLFKAIQSAVFNRFRSGCVRFGQDESIIRLRYSDSPLILEVRKQPQGSPLISLGCKAQGYKTYSKLNRDVPPEVSSFNNFGKIKTSSSEDVSLNFVNQFTPPLLIQFSPKKIVDILSYSKASQDLLKVKRTLDEDSLTIKGSLKNMDTICSQQKEDVIKKQNQLKKYVHVEEVKSTLNSCKAKEELLSSLRTLTQSLRTLTQVTSSISTTQKLLSSLRTASQLSLHISSLRELQSSINQLHSTSHQTSVISNNLPLISSQISLTSLRNYISQLNSINITPVLSITTILNKITTLSNSNTSLKQLQELINNLQTVRIGITDLTYNRDNNICPFCGSKFTPDQQLNE